MCHEYSLSNFFLGAYLFQNHLPRFYKFGGASMLLSVRWLKDIIILLGIGNVIKFRLILKYFIKKPSNTEWSKIICLKNYQVSLHVRFYAYLILWGARKRFEVISCNISTVPLNSTVSYDNTINNNNKKANNNTTLYWVNMTRTRP
jgi:hypothetical protein